jgi:plasmid maintenance system antidote protein VapI
VSKRQKHNPLAATSKLLGDLMVRTRLSPREIAQRFGVPEGHVDEMLRSKRAIPLYWIQNLGELAKHGRG